MMLGAIQVLRNREWEGVRFPGDKALQRCTFIVISVMKGWVSNFQKKSVT